VWSKVIGSIIPSIEMLTARRTMLSSSSMGMLLRTGWILRAAADHVRTWGKETSERWRGRRVMAHSGADLMGGMSAAGERRHATSNREARRRRGCCNSPGNGKKGGPQRPPFSACVPNEGSPASGVNRLSGPSHHFSGWAA
jgi:hypothetical protein